MDYTFHPTLVEPFYGLLMAGNFLRPNIIVNHPEFASNLKSTLPAYSNLDLRVMLQDSWRPQKVAAWVIGLKRMLSWEDDVAKVLLSSKAEAEHLVIAIILLRTENGANILEEYLISRFQDQEVDINSFDRLSLSIGWALSGWEMLREYSSNNLMESKELLKLCNGLQQVWWSKVSKNFKNAPTEIPDRYRFELDFPGYSDEISNIIEYCKENLAYKI